ncbi:MAG: Crp/Fnr family transcriptional regulator [Candidatus Sulfotelmatobacter sp.]
MTDKRHTPLSKESVEPSHCTLPQRLRLLAQSPFFTHVSAEEVEQISGVFHEMSYRAGETAYFAGDPAVRLYIVAAGKIKLVQATPDGRSVVLGILVAGDFFGSLSSLGDEKYPDTAVAHTDCCTLTVTARDFKNILCRYPVVAISSLEIVATRLHAMHELVEQLSAHSVEQRIASTLLKLGEQLGEKRGRGLLIQMPLSRQDLAEMTGTTPETVSRVMSQFRQAGLVRSGRRWVSILDVKGVSDILSSRLSR